MELWFVPPKTIVPKHVHENVKIFLIVIFGVRSVFCRESKTIHIRAKDFGRVFTISPNQPHSVKTDKFPLFFINVEWWNKTPTSAGADFKLV